MQPLEPVAEGGSVSPALRGCPRVAIVAAGPEIRGGHWIQARALSEGLAKKGYAPSFCQVNPAFPRRLAWARDFRGLRTLVNEAFYVPSLARLKEADVVHVFAASYWSFLLGPAPAIVIGRALGKRVVLNYHSGEAHDHLTHWGALVHPFLRMADEIVVPSNYLRDVFARHGYSVRVIPNVVDLDRFRYRERVPLEPRILSSRNLEPHYGVDRIIKAFSRVQEDWPKATLTIVGYGSEEKRLRRLARALALRGVCFLGRVEPREMPAVYDAADIYVNASLIDNQPVSILESQASGLPIVSTPVGDIPSLIRHGESGVLVNPPDPAGLARAVLSLLRYPEQARALSKRARVAVERFTWTRVVRQWADLYGGAAA